MNSDVNDKNNSLKNSKEILPFHEEVFCAVEDGKNKIESIITTSQKEEIIEYCKQEVSYTRIYLLRHPPYLDDDKYKEYRRLKELFKKDSKLITDIGTFTQLDNDLKIDFSKVNTALFNGVFQDPQNTLLIHHPLSKAKNRFIETVEYIKDKYQGITTREEQVRGSIKGVYEMLSLANAATDIANIVCKMVQSKDEEIPQNYKGKSIVILGSRSHSHFLNLDKFNVNGKRENVEEFIGDGYNFVDLYDNFKRVNNKDNLIVTPTNYHEIVKIFGLEGSNIPILNLQNGLNLYFENNPEQYETYLFSQNEDLRVFCISKLLTDKEDQNNIKKVIAYYNQAKAITKKEEDILILNLDIISIKKLYVNLSLKKKVTGNENIESLSKIFQIQYRSLDSQIKKQDEKGILKRELQRITRTTNISTKEITYSYHDVDIDYILKNGGQKFVLPAHVGSGKSIWLSEFAKKVIFEHPEYSVHFFEGKDFNHQYDENSVTEIFEELLTNTDDSKIIFVDAIDEIIDTKIKNRILEMIQNSKNKIIISGRLSEFQEKYNEGFITLGFQNISKEKFIHEKIDDEEKRKEILDFLEKSNLAQEIEGNPLLLNFVCILANLDDEKKQEYIKIGVKELQKIKNKADLYESITRLVIFEHNVSKGHRIGKRELENSINDLSKKAFDVFSGVSIDNDFDDNDLQKLSILFKKSGTGEYEFIHHSFYEFFLAKYLSSCNNGNEQIYQVREQKAGVNNWNVWNSFQPVVLFYGEILANNKNYDALFELLGEKGILENDDIFGQGYFVGLEILYKTEKQLNSELGYLLSNYSGENGKKTLEIYDYLLQIATLKKLYLEILSSWDNETDLLGKSLLFHKFQKNVSYQENIFAQNFVNKIIKSKLSIDGYEGPGYEFIKSRQYHKILIQMGLSTLMTYNEAFKKSSENENLNRGFPEINDNPQLNYYYGNLFLQGKISMYNEYYSKYFYAGKYFMQAAKSGYKDAIEKLFLCMDYLIQDKSNHNIIMHWMKGILNEQIVSKIYDYFNQGYFDKDEIYNSLIEILKIKPRNIKVNKKIIHYFKDFLVQMNLNERDKLLHSIFPDTITYPVGFEQICFEDYLLVDEKNFLSIHNNDSCEQLNQEDKTEKKRKLLESFYSNIERANIILAVRDFKAILEINGVENKEESYGLLKDFEEFNGQQDGDIDKNALNQLTGVYDIYDYFSLNLGYPFSIPDLKQREYIGMYDFLKQAKKHNIKIS